MTRPTPAVLLAVCLALGCARGELPRPTTPLARVAAGQPQARTLVPTPAELGADTARAHALAAALSAAVPTAVPLREAFFLGAREAAAQAWSFEVRAGQLLEVQLQPVGDAALPMLELLEHPSPDEYRPVTGGRGPLTSLAWEAPAAGTYVLLASNAPGRSGRYLLTVDAPTGLAFPVAGQDARAIRGSFGDSRSGGRREHEGVDIFAPRGTPVLAAAPALVTRVETDRTGGRVIWALDEANNLSYFYAHLDRQLVRRGARIAAGDTIGLVGNTGNARRSSPHLHFGVYLPGTVPVDPAPLLASAPPPPLEPGDLLPADTAPADTAPADSALAGLGAWARTRTGPVRLRDAPDRAARVVSELGEGTVVLLVGAVKEWRRIRLPDGTGGFVANWLLAPLAGSL